MDEGTSHSLFDPIDLKFTGCIHGCVVNNYSKFEVILTK